MNDYEKSEAAEGATSTTSESHDPGYHDEVEESAATVANAPTESKSEHLSTTAHVSAEDPGTDEVIASQASNPFSTNGNVPDAAVAPSKNADPEDKPATGEPSRIDAPRKKGGRPRGSKNRAGKKKPSAKNSAEQGTKHSLLEIGVGATFRQAGELVEVKASDLILRPPFSDLFPADEQTRNSIKFSIESNGFDNSQPIHAWRNGKELIATDGCTRLGIVLELGIPTISAFIHDFPDEKAALEFAMGCQVKRRNLSDGDLARFVELVDVKFTPGATQARAEKGMFQPIASGDAAGKSAAQTAAKLGVSTSKVERARRVNQKADEATKKAVHENKITVNKALAQIKAAKVKSKSFAPSQPPVAPSPKASGGNAGGDELDDLREAHFKAIEALDGIETFLRRSKDHLTVVQKADWKTSVLRIVALLTDLGVTMSVS